MIKIGKLPKALREKKKKNKSLRRQGSAPGKAPAGGGKGLNRQMRRKMKQQGVEGMEPIEAKRVIIQTEEGDLVVEDPQVIKMNQQGMEIYQVVGKAVMQDAGDYAAGAGGDAGDDFIDDGLDDIDLQDTDDTVLNVEITEQDIQLVAMQTGESPKAAESALRAANGDLARAIIDLKTR